MKFITKNKITTKQRYSEFTKLTNNQLSILRGGENLPTIPEEVNNKN